ncbi:chemosensory protein 15 precursor [Tribolium castaneum]|uniref:Chemosensory protein 15 n=1 Tax=Tribolium castaneum TaxID=7070 RepID=Q0MRK8_TRICA|nr:chemosensory protein 15 precursor [Tribolium castaneum]ABH88188.1 chemosensory protein 15 [Tribolium castaneum]EFA07640.1 chemosensory protein 8 [Tribolium castaneum]|eukprot:NP_001039291.1 chemosensory protein 15 precursor [Tribolium castaneum]
MIFKIHFLVFGALLTYVSSVEYLILREIDTILKNDQMTRNYLDCVLDKGKCTKEAEKLKKGITETMKNGCVKCEQKQKEDVHKVFQHLMIHRPNWWHELETKFNPHHEIKLQHLHQSKFNPHEEVKLQHLHQFPHHDFLEREGFIR